MKYDILSLLGAGAVKRMHTRTIHGEYTVAQHCYNVVTLLLTLHPDPPLHLIKMALWHDSAELELGDLPATAKWNHTELSNAYHATEDKVMREHFGLGADMNEMSGQDQQWLKALDMIEFWLWAKEQHWHGSARALVLVNRARDHLSEHWHEIPAQCQAFISERAADAIQ